jgi:hypothetical protein
MTTTPRRRSRTRAITLGLGTALALVLAMATPAGAVGTVSVTPPTGTYYVNTQLVDVSGTIPTGTVSVAVAQCNVSTGVTPGTRCHISTALSPDDYRDSTTTYLVEDFVLASSWTTDWNLTTGSPTPGTTGTTCTSSGTSACAVVVSFYGTTGHLGSAVSSTLVFTP